MQLLNHTQASTSTHGASTLQLPISLLSTRFWSSTSHQVGYCSKVEAGVSRENCYPQLCKTLKRRMRISFWLSGSLLTLNWRLLDIFFNVTYSKMVDKLVSSPTHFGIGGLFSRHQKGSVFDESGKRLKEINFLTNRSFNFGHKTSSFLFVACTVDDSCHQDIVSTLHSSCSTSWQNWTLNVYTVCNM